MLNTVLGGEGGGGGGGGENQPGITENRLISQKISKQLMYAEHWLSSSASNHYFRKILLPKQRINSFLEGIDQQRAEA